MSLADTRAALLAELDDGDKTVAKLADALDLSTIRVTDLLRTMPDDCHCITPGNRSLGTYRRGPAPDDIPQRRRTPVQCKAEILKQIAHEFKTTAQIAESIGITVKYTNTLVQMLFAEGKTEKRRSPMPGGGYTVAHRAKDWTPPPVVDRVILPAWAAALAFA